VVGKNKRGLLFRFGSLVCLWNLDASHFGSDLDSWSRTGYAAVRQSVSAESASGDSQVKLLCVLILFLSVGSSALCADTLTLYSAQRGIRPTYAHTFARFTRDGKPDVVINWLPVDGRIIRVIPGAGRNLSLAESFEQAKKNGQTVKSFGPYLVKPGLYELAAAQKSRLDSFYRYKAFDLFSRRRGVAVNCVHAVSDVDGRPVTFPFFGDAAAEILRRHFSRWIIETKEPPLAKRWATTP
jgi:hypothetical protein